jgi:hypothetical protein
MSPTQESRWTTWGTVSSGSREIELRGDRLESVGHLAPFLAPGSTRHDPAGTSLRRGMEKHDPTPDALLEDYKLKVSVADSQIGRLQTQFQVLLALESLLATALIVSNTGSLSKGAKWIVLVELMLSVAWLMLGWAGTTRTRLHRMDVEHAGHAWGVAAGLGAAYRPAGTGQKPLRIAIAVPAVATIGWAAFFIALLVST